MYQVTCLLKGKHKYCTPIPEITVMMETTFFINIGKTGGQSTTTKPPSQSSTVQPTSVSGNLHAERKTQIYCMLIPEITLTDNRNAVIHEFRENMGTIFDN